MVKVRGFLISVIACLWASQAFSQGDARKVVRVVGYNFPPYVSEAGGKGITRGFLRILNREQDRFQFTFKLTSAKRRYADLQHGRGDMLIFESFKWGWEESGVAVSATAPFLSGGEIFVGLHAAVKDQSYFKNLEKRRLAGILGYHYGFADFNADPGWLQSRFNIRLGTNHARNIWLVETGRVEIAIMPRAYFSRYLLTHPGKDKVLIRSDRLDQEYLMGAIISDRAPINAVAFNAILEKIRLNGKLPQFPEAQGIGDQILN